MKKIGLITMVFALVLHAENINIENTFKVNGALLNKDDRTYSFLTSEKNFLPIKDVLKCVYSSSFELNKEKNVFQSRLESFICVTKNDTTINGSLKGLLKDNSIQLKELSPKELTEYSKIFGTTLNNKDFYVIPQDTELTYTITEINIEK